MKGYFGIDSKELKRFKKDAVGFKRCKKGKDYNFGISKKELARIKKQVRA